MSHHGNQAISYNSLFFQTIVRCQRLANACLICKLPEASGHRQVTVRGPCLLHRKFTLHSTLTQGHAENRRAVCVYGRALAYPRSPAASAASVGLMLNRGEIHTYAVIVKQAEGLLGKNVSKETSIYEEHVTWMTRLGGRQ